MVLRDVRYMDRNKEKKHGFRGRLSHRSEQGIRHVVLWNIRRT